MGLKGSYKQRVPVAERQAVELPVDSLKDKSASFTHHFPSSKNNKGLRSAFTPPTGALLNFDSV